MRWNALEICLGLQFFDAVAGRHCGTSLGYADQTHSPPKKGQIAGDHLMVKPRDGAEPRP